MRLLPRFSLRSALLALTIFLIVFGVGVKYWRDYGEHERLARVFNRNGMIIEEEPLTLAGYFVGKRLTGLLVKSHYADASDIELLRQLPRPRDVRRLSFVGGEKLKDQFHKILESISLFPELEALELQGFELTPEHFEQLKQFRRLEYLSLSKCQLPADSRALFSGMNSLKTLLLQGYYSEIEIQQFLENDLPQLEYLSLSGGKFDGTLDLTREGFGRLPQLQYLTTSWLDFQRIKCEDDALPRLRYLDLRSLSKGATIPWQELVRCAPNLEALSVDLQHLNEEAIPALASWKQLIHWEYNTFRDYGLSESPIPQVLLTTTHGDKLINKDKLQVATELVKRCPQLQWHSVPYRRRDWDGDDWQRDFFLPQRSIDQKFMRESKNWRQLQ